MFGGCRIFSQHLDSLSHRTSCRDTDTPSFVGIMKGLVSSVSGRLSYNSRQSNYESNPGSILFNWNTKVVSVVMGHCKHTFDDCDEIFNPDGGEIILVLDTIQDTIQFATRPRFEFGEEMTCSRKLHHANVVDKVFHFVADFGEHGQMQMIGYQCFGVALETRRQLASNCATAIVRDPNSAADPCFSIHPRLIVIGGNIHGCVSIASGAVTSIHSSAGQVVSLACEPVDFEIQVRGPHVSKLYCGLVCKSICRSLHYKRQSGSPKPDAGTDVKGMGDTTAATDDFFAPARAAVGGNASSAAFGGADSGSGDTISGFAIGICNDTPSSEGDSFGISTAGEANVEEELRHVYRTACSVMYTAPETEGKQGWLSVWHKGKRIAHCECLLKTEDTLGYSFKPESGCVRFLLRSEVVAEICIYGSDSKSAMDFVSMMSMGDAGAHVQIRRNLQFPAKQTPDVSSSSAIGSSELSPRNDFTASTLTTLRELSDARANCDRNAFLRVGPAPFRFSGLDTTPGVQLATLTRFDGNRFEACTALAGHIALAYLLRLSTAGVLQLLKSVQPRALMTGLQRLTIAHRRAFAAKLRKAQRTLLDSDVKKRLTTASVDFVESSLARFADLWSTYDDTLLLSERSTKVFESSHPLPACSVEKKMTLQRMPNDTAAIELVFDARSELDAKADSMTVDKILAHPGGDESTFKFDACKLPCRRGQGLLSLCLEPTFVFTRDGTKLESNEKWGYRLLVHPIIARPRTLVTANAFSSFDMQMMCEMLLFLNELARPDPKVEQSIVQGLQYSLQTASSLSNETHCGVFATIAQIFGVIKRKQGESSTQLQTPINSITEALVSRCRAWLQLGRFLHALSLSLANTNNSLFRSVTTCALEANLTFRGATECAPVSTFANTRTYHPSLIALSAHVYPAHSHIRVLGSNTVEVTKCDTETNWQTVVATLYYKQGRCQWQVSRFGVRIRRTIMLILPIDTLACLGVCARMCQGCPSSCGRSEKQRCRIYRE